MSMPWDRFKPEVEYVPTPSPVPAPEVTYDDKELPYLPPANLPERIGGLDFGNILKDALGSILADALKDRGEKPVPTPETSRNKELVVADAKSRSWRTLVQGLIVDVFFAIIAAIAMFAGADLFVMETWVAMGILVFKSVLSAVISYFMRLRGTPTIRVPGERMAMMPIPGPMVEK